MDTWDALDFLRAYVDGDQRDIILVLTAVTCLILVLFLVQFIKVRRLRKQIDALQLSVQRLITADETRLLRELRGQTKPKAPE